MPQVVSQRTWRAFFEDNMQMDKTELIESIREINKTARPEFLAKFSERELTAYLKHLMQSTAAEMAVTS